MIKSSNHVFSLHAPSHGAVTLPVVIDSPHSGTEYPFNSAIVAPGKALMTTCDAFVNELWQDSTACGLPLLSARFPRAYIDPNRAPWDIDATLLEGKWPTPLTPSPACLRGMGLIRMNALPGVPMYAHKLSVAEVSARIVKYYDPYHLQLQTLLDSAHARFGHVWHINCHSMKSLGNAMNVDYGSERPDVVVSDFNGRAASSEFTRWVARQFEGLGYRTLINTPYQGGYIVQKFGAPEAQRHSVQIELKRSLYLDERTYRKSPNFPTLQRDIGTFVDALCGYVRHALGIDDSRHFF